MAVHTRAEFQNVISKDFDKIWIDTRKQHPTQYSRWCNVMSSKEPYIKEGNLVGIPNINQIDEGGIIPSDQIEEDLDKKVEFDYFAMSAQITSIAEEDDWRKLLKLPRELAKAADHTVEQEAHDILNSGFSGGGTGLDALQLFVSNHPQGNTGQTQSNLVTGSLSMDTLETMKERFQRWEEESGKPRLLVPRMLVIPPELEWVAKKLLLSPYDPDNANMQYNPAKDLNLQYLVDVYLSSTTAFFMLAAKGEHDLRHVWKRKFRQRTYMDPSTENMLYTITARWQDFHMEWAGTVASAGA